MTISESKTFRVFLNEQTVRELYLAVQSANASGRPIGAIELTSPDEPHSFEVTLGESGGRGYSTTRETMYSPSPDIVDPNGTVAFAGFLAPSLSEVSEKTPQVAG